MPLGRLCSTPQEKAGTHIMERRPQSAVLTHRTLSFVSDRLVVSGDLPRDRTQALAQLNMWATQGITHVMDLREEASDEEFVTQHSELGYIWLGVDDNGSPRTDEWFDTITKEALDVLAKDDTRLLIHCHMGVNRAPSAMFAVLLVLGYSIEEALSTIRTARDIAGIIYAPDAARWFAAKNHTDPRKAAEDELTALLWLQRHPVDVSWVISQIGSRTA